MRKLAIACMSGAAAVFLSFYILPHLCLLPAAVTCTLAATGIFFLRRRNDGMKRLFLCLLGASLGFSVYLLHWNLVMPWAERMDGTEQHLTVRLMEEPTNGGYYIRIHVQNMGTPKLDLMLYDYRGEEFELRPGEILQVTAKLRRADLIRGEKSGNYLSRNILLTGTVRELTPVGRCHPTIRTVAADLSARLSRYAAGFFSPDTSVFLRALLLGDKSDFYDDLPLYASMRGAGFMHVVAVSGMHIAFLAGMIQLFFGAKPSSSVAGILLVWFFVFLTGASPSAVRAGTMQSVLLLAPIFRRENDPLTSLAAALALILLANPFACASISLQLSFSAMAGMVLLAEPLTAAMLNALGRSEESRLRAPVAVVASSFAVLICSAPLSSIHFGTLALWAPITNLLGLWAVSLCFCMGWIACAAGQLLTMFPFLRQILAFPAEMLARYLIWLARTVCQLPHHLISMNGTGMRLWLLLSYALVLIAWRTRAGHRFRVFLPLGLCTVTLVAILRITAWSFQSAELVISALDVGQGECVCVLSGDRTLMFDCGSIGTLDNASETAADWLEGTGRKRVDTLILSHLHEDHTNGVPLLLELMPVEEIVLSPDADADEGMLSEIQAAAMRHGTTVTYLTRDTQKSYGKIQLQMFAPPEDSSENERCIISLVSVGDYDMLFTGDSLKNTEMDLIERHELPDMELLIVGHHGSKTSSDPAFLEAIRAEDAIISVGRNNSYGHPAWQTLMRLQMAGCNVYRTDRNGTVEVRISPAQGISYERKP